MTAHAKSEGTPQYLTIAEAAALYHVSRDFLRHRIVDGTCRRFVPDAGSSASAGATWSGCSVRFSRCATSSDRIRDVEAGAASSERSSWGQAPRISPPSDLAIRLDR